MPSNLSKSITKLRKAIDLSDEEYRSEAEQIFDPKEPNAKKLTAQLLEEWTFMETNAQRRLIVGLRRLKLYNNQARKDEDFGDSSMFTNHQTVLSTLYNDKLQLEAEARTERDEDCAANYNALAEFDYDEMDKAQLDYDVYWDTTAFGTGLRWFNDFDLKTKTPIPQYWNSLTFMRDPASKSPNGDKLGQGAMRFGGREIWLSKDKMKENPEYFNLNLLKRRSPGSTSVTLMEVERLRAEAQGRDFYGQDLILSESAQFPVRQSLTIIGGKKFVIETVNECKVIVRITPIENRRNRWPLIVSNMYKMTDTWDCPGVFDLTEDKQRFRAMLINIYGKSAKADLYPMYMFDASKAVKNADYKFGYNKFIPFNGPVGGDNAVAPLRKAQPSEQGKYILDSLELMMQKALATPDVQMGQPSNGLQTKGETVIQKQGVDTRYSLTAAVFGFSEREFWDRHYEIYDENFEEGIHKKEVRLQGADVPEYKEFKRSDIIATHPEGFRLKIESRDITEQKNSRVFGQMGNYLGIAMSLPNADKTYAIREWGKKILPKYKVERIIPLSAQEIEAQEENEKLNEGKAVKVNLWDDHTVHMRENAKADVNPASKAHLKAHRDAQVLKLMFPQHFPVHPGDAVPGGQPANPAASSAPAFANQQQNLPAPSSAAGSGAPGGM